MPGILCWVSLIAWSNDYRPGENWWPVLRQIALLAISSLASILFAFLAIKKRKSVDWWIAALVNLTAPIGTLVWLWSPI